MYGTVHCRYINFYVDTVEYYVVSTAGINPAQPLPPGVPGGDLHLLPSRHILGTPPALQVFQAFPSLGTPPALQVFPALGHLQFYKYLQPWDTSSTTGIPIFPPLNTSSTTCIPSLGTPPALQVFPALTPTALEHLQHYKYSQPWDSSSTTGGPSPSLGTHPALQVLPALGHLHHYRYSLH
jgi:hypothetical protein